MKILSVILVFVSYMLASTASWIPRKFSDVTYEQIVFHLNVPLEGEAKLVYSYLQNTVLIAVILSVVFFVVIRDFSPRKSIKYAVFFTVISLFWSYHKMNIGNILREMNNRTVMGTLYEKYYVDPHKTLITPPPHKRNLVMIFLESMETAYANPEYFGTNLIPELEALAQNKDNINFSDNEGFGGFYNISGANYTQASLVSQLCAVPLRLPVNVRRYHPKNGFLPKALCLSDILTRDGYNQSFMLGMTRVFAGTDKFLETHGNSKILDWDFYSDRDNLSRNNSSRRKRTVRDDKLFDYAKEELAFLSKQDKPFSFTMMTMDTHFGTENFSRERCEVKYHDSKTKDEEYFKNVVSCSSLQISAFVEWIKEQPFFENTEVVLVGDHPTMSQTIFTENMKRRVYNVYINSSIKENHRAKQRRFTALDTFPTLLEGMGYTIDGRKLGLGVSLFSNHKTLLEQFELDALNNELEKQSAIYNKLLYGADVK